MNRKTQYCSRCGKHDVSDSLQLKSGQTGETYLDAYVCLVCLKSVQWFLSGEADISPAVLTL